MRADCKGVGGETMTLLEGEFTLLFGVKFQEFRIVVHRGHDNDILEVLCGGADQRDASDVNLFDDVLLGSATGNSLFEGVEVDDDEVYLRDLIFIQLFSVAEHVATTQNTAKNLWVKSLYAASEDGGIAGQRLDGYGFDAEVFDEFVCSAGGIDGDALGVESFNDVLQTVFVEYGDEG